MSELLAGGLFAGALLGLMLRYVYNLGWAQGFRAATDQAVQSIRKVAPLLLLLLLGACDERILYCPDRVDFYGAHTLAQTQVIAAAERLHCHVKGTVRWVADPIPYQGVLAADVTMRTACGIEATVHRCDRMAHCDSGQIINAWDTALPHAVAHYCLGDKGRYPNGKDSSALYEYIQALRQAGGVP